MFILTYVVKNIGICNTLYSLDTLNRDVNHVIEMDNRKISFRCINTFIPVHFFTFVTEFETNISSCAFAVLLVGVWHCFHMYVYICWFKSIINKLFLASLVLALAGIS